MSETSGQLLNVENVSKRFGGVQALKEVSFDLNYGEVHALVGENGAGKSTLMNILGGIVQNKSGRLTYRGQDVDFKSPIESLAAGIAVIHQELAMLPHLNVIENLLLGRMPSNGGVIDWGEARRQSLAALDLVGLKIDPETQVSRLSISQRQLVEIARALSGGAQLIIMDEPNSSLSEAETARLFEVIEGVKARHGAVIYVSHKIEEVLRIADRISVLRDGEYRGTLPRADSTVEKVIHMMVGRELRQEAERLSQTAGQRSDKVRLQVKNLSGSRFQDVSFSLYEGEILGFAGLVGAGRSDVARAIFGADPIKGGEILLEGKPVQFKSPDQAITHGLAMVPEDRKLLSLFMDLPILFNMSIAEMPRMTNYTLLNHRRVRSTAERFVEKLHIKLASLDSPVRSLSGGNQQKTTLARWLATGPRLLIMDEPTHGVDVGAKAEIYELMRGLANEGISILLISSELPEILTLADRVIVMSEGRVTATLTRDEANEQAIMMYATGMAETAA
ncbi:MAG: sugar ABC transporter ATP-binding protein [Chloroflexota bacterium]